VIVNVIPAAVILPDLAGPVFGSTVNETVPLPLPLNPDVMWIHESPVVADHPQPVPARTLKLPFPPAAVKFALDAERLYEQGIPWFTVSVYCTDPAVTVIWPLLGAPVLLASNVKLSEDGKVPKAVPDEFTICNQGVFVEAVHET